MVYKSMNNTNLLEELGTITGAPVAVVRAAVAEAAPLMKSSGVNPENLVNDGAGGASRSEIAWAVFGPVLRRAKEAAED